VQQLAIVARLRPGAEHRAASLIEQGPPFQIGESGLERHTVYLSAGEVVFVFEGHEVEWIVDAMIDDPFRPTLSDAFANWRPLAETEPRIARPAFSWQRDERAPEP
jgi:hypothetical protein